MYASKHSNGIGCPALGSIFPPAQSLISELTSNSGLPSPQSTLLRTVPRPPSVLQDLHYLRCRRDLSLQGWSHLLNGSTMPIRQLQQ